MRMIVGLTLILLFPTASVFGEDTLTEVGHKPRLKNEKKIKASFAKLAPMLAKLPDDSDLTLYQGLPRHRGSVDEQDAQYDAKSMIKRFGHVFYNTPNEVAAEDKIKLSDLVKDPQAFVQFRGYKFCGGFHPDVALVWGKGNNAVEIHVCFGCHELKAFRKSVEVYCDIPNATFDELKKLLEKYQQQHAKSAAGQ